MTLVVDIYVGNALLASRVTLRQVRVSADGSVAGQIRQVDGLEADADGLRFQLPDGRTVVFRVFQAGDAIKWGKFDGRVL